ncbi:hypothetical protein BKI52_03230 [marine bacterium AO1-C]|nr:hypothetical protein BKI52_03230 [marine bacterium AO1-C]
MKNLKKLLLVFLSIWFVEPTTFAQSNANVIGSKYTIASKVLGTDKEIQVYLPDTYQTSKEKYSVLYVIDGQWYFPLSVGVQHMLTQFKGASVTPKFIIVSIVNANMRQRYRLLVGQKAKYQQFIAQELIPMVEGKFRTTKERFLFGWQFAGSFALRVAGTNPTLFNACFAADPYPLMTKFDTDVKDLYDALPQIKQVNNLLCFYVGEHGETVTEGANYLNDFLVKTKAKQKGMQWVHQDLAGEEHRSTPFAALYRGLKRYYHNYPELVLHSFAEYKQKGGLEYIRNYYKERAKRFGFGPEVKEWTLFTLLRSAARANQLEQFQQLMKDFESEDFINKVRIQRALSVLSFYMRNQQPASALKYYRELEKKNANSARLHNAMGDAYLALNDKAKAKVCYKKAVELGTAQKDRRLPTYKKNLAKADGSK